MMQPVWTKHQELWAARLTYSGLIMFQRAGSVVHLSLLSQCHVTLGNPQRQPPHSSTPQIRSCACVSAPSDLCLTSLPRVWSLWCWFTIPLFSFKDQPVPAGTRPMWEHGAFSWRGPHELRHHRLINSPDRRGGRRFNYNNRSLCWEPRRSTSGKPRAAWTFVAPVQKWEILSFGSL